MQIPKIIHQIWYQGYDKLPEKYHPMQQSWKDFHPHWAYYLWDREKIEQLIEESYPDVYDTYIKLPRMIQKIDFAKYIILHKYGGVYIDMDMKCLKCLDYLFKEYPDKNLFATELNIGCTSKWCLSIWVATEGKYVNGPLYNNAFFACIPEHKFWKDVINEVSYNKQRKWYQTFTQHLLNSTGPMMITHVLRSTSHDFQSLPSTMFEPCRKHQIKCDLTHSYAIHYFSNSWMSPSMKIITFFYFRPWLIIIAFIGLVAFFTLKIHSLNI
jgi:mannosyltransferase OCH1-like enzyme